MRRSRRQIPSLRSGWGLAAPSATAILLGILGTGWVAQCVLALLPTTGLAEGHRYPEIMGLHAGGLATGRLWQLFTFPLATPSLFESILAFTLVALSGRSFEKLVGRWHLVGVHLAGSLSAGIFHWGLHPDVPLTGASVCAASVLAAYSTVFGGWQLPWAGGCSGRIQAVPVAAIFVGCGAVLWWLWPSQFMPPGALCAGAFSGWIYARRLGFGRPFPWQGFLSERRVRDLRLTNMGAAEFVRDQIDPILEKISREGVNRLTRAERRTLERGRQKLAADPRSKSL